MAADPMTKYLPAAVWKRHCHYICNKLGPLPEHPAEDKAVKFKGGN